ncbi:MAG: hypothetical protein HGA45_00360 [Chloroflexales bacterium]|nr:hypothetical protein [Chloroflexales bacterium]
MASRHPERLIGLYWLISIAIGLFALWDWLTAWNVPATFSQPWLVAYLCFSFVLSQSLYILVARHNGRPIHLGALTIFAIGNGIAETLAFATVYRLGELIGSRLVSIFAPDFAAIAGFIIGVTFFSIYGGLIHGLFWLRVLPPHLDDNPRSQSVRKLRPVAEVVLVIGWSLCLTLNRDIWTVIFFHTLVDVGLMILVRPAIFGASSETL